MVAAAGAQGSINRLSDYGLQLEDFRQLKADFESIDTDGSGTLEYTEVSDLLAQERGYAEPADVMATMAMFDTNGENQVSLEEYVSTLVAPEDGSARWWLGGDTGWWNAVLEGQVRRLPGPSEVSARINEIEGSAVVEDPNAQMLQQCMAVCSDLVDQDGVKLFDATAGCCSWQSCKSAISGKLRTHNSVPVEVVIEVEKAADGLLPPLASRGMSPTVAAEFMAAVVGAAEAAAPEMVGALLEGWGLELEEDGELPVVKVGY